MATSKITFDEGTTTNVATNTISEDAVTKHINRSILNNSSGTEIGTNANPIQIGDAGGSITVDGTVAVTNAGLTELAAAINASSQMDVNVAAALPAGTNNIGDVDVLSCALPTGASTSAKQDSEIALLTTIDADTSNVSLKIDTIAGAVSGTEMQVDVLTMPSVAVTNAGTFAVQDAAAEASLSVLDDWDESDRAKVNIIVGQAGVAAGVGATGATVQRVVQANDAGKTLVSAGGSASSSGNNTLVLAGTNKLKVYAFSLSTTSATAVTCIFQSGAGGTELWRVVLQAATSTSTGANLCVTPPAYLFATASATLLNLNLSGAIAVNWSVSYFDEA